MFIRFSKKIGKFSENCSGNRYTLLNLLVIGIRVSGYSNHN